MVGSWVGMVIESDESLLLANFFNSASFASISSIIEIDPFPWPFIWGPFMASGISSSLLSMFSLCFPHRTEYSPMTINTAPSTLRTHKVNPLINSHPLQLLIYSYTKLNPYIIILLIRSCMHIYMCMHASMIYILKWTYRKLNYPPRKIFSARMKEPMTATMIIIKGLKAVANTGPLFFITSPCT